MKKTLFFDFSGTLVRMRPPELLVDVNILENLSDKFELGIITGARKAETLNILNKLKIKDLFQIVITADDSRLRKPNPGLFPKIKIAAYIGDMRKDEFLAKNAKVPFFRINKKYNINQILKKILL